MTVMFMTRRSGEPAGIKHFSQAAGQNSKFKAFQSNSKAFQSLSKQKFLHCFLVRWWSESQSQASFAIRPVAPNCTRLHPFAPGCTDFLTATCSSAL